MATKYDSNLEGQMRQWISQVTGSNDVLDSNASLQQILKNGVIMCQLVFGFFLIN